MDGFPIHDEPANRIGYFTIMDRDEKNSPLYKRES